MGFAWAFLAPSSVLLAAAGIGISAVEVDGNLLSMTGGALVSLLLLLVLSLFDLSRHVVENNF